MVEVKKYLDTYALVEIIYQNPKFAHYLTAEFVVSDLTLAEFYGVLLKDESPELAEEWFKKLEPYALSVSRELLREAVKFRFDNRRRDISFFDAVGYVFAMRHGYLFVTGDKEFEKLPG